MKPRVLIVDDDATTRTALAQLLEEAGYEAITAGTFQEGNVIIRTGSPDLLITDIRLEAYNGLQLIVSSPRYVPAIVVTGFADSVLEAEARRRGAEYLVKPVQPGVLLDLIERKLSAAREGFRQRRRWERKPVVSGLSAEIGGVSARVVDVSYGGMRLEIEQPPPEQKPGDRLDIRLPEAGLAMRADLVWANLIQAATWAWGASIGADLPSPDWRRVVDAVP